VNEHVEREIRLFQTQERDFFLESISAPAGTGPDGPEFPRGGHSEDLTWLPLIESGFKVRALSRARALGLWQFIPSTGYKFGLTRNAAIERTARSGEGHGRGDRLPEGAPPDLRRLGHGPRSL